MGEPKRRMELEAVMVAVDLAAPDVLLSRSQKRTWAEEAERAGIKSLQTEECLRVLAVTQTIQLFVQAAYPQGMDERDSAIWAVWLDLFAQEDEDGDQLRHLTVARRYVEWFAEHAKKDLRLPPGVAQWREAVKKYFLSLLAEDTKKAEDA